MLLVIDKKNSLIRNKSDVLWIYQEEQLAKKIPIRLLEQVVVYGNPMAETSVWRALAEAGVATVFLSTRGAKRQAVFVGATLACQLGSRMNQYAIAFEADKKLMMARYILLRKAKSYLFPLLILNRYCPSAIKTSEHFLSNCRETEDKIQSAQNIPALMGLEGSMAAAWFKLLADNFPSHLGFQSRNRRPPKDPINALLSLSYTLLAGEIQQQAIVYGLDPSLGFLHQPEPGRESLVLDILEVFRAAGDAFVITWSMQNQQHWEDYFYNTQKDGCRLSKMARPEFFNAWINYCQNWPRPFDSGGVLADWSEASLREIIGGELAGFREQIKVITGRKDD